MKEIQFKVREIQIKTFHVAGIHVRSFTYFDTPKRVHSIHASMPSLLRGLTDDFTQVERRLRHLENVIYAAIPCITPLLCMNTCNHVRRHFGACLALIDLYMGDNVR